MCVCIVPAMRKATRRVCENSSDMMPGERPFATTDEGFETVFVLAGTAVQCVYAYMCVLRTDHLCKCLQSELSAIRSNPHFFPVGFGRLQQDFRTLYLPSIKRYRHHSSNC